jgi:V/A-type H+-transporting ATPase subunit I
MKHLLAVVLESDIDKVTKELLRQGVFHFVKMRELGSKWASKVEPVSPRIAEVRIGETRKRIESLLSVSGYTPSDGKTLEISQLKPLDLEESEKILDKIGASLQAVRDRQKTIQQDILKIEDISRQLELFGDLETGIRSQSRYSFLNIQFGTIPIIHEEAMVSALREMPSVRMKIREEGKLSYTLLITMKRDDSVTNKILERFGWVDAEFTADLSGLGPGVVTDLEERLAGLRKEQERLNQNAQELIDNERGRLDAMWRNLRLNELYARIQSKFSHTSRTMIFSGWLPASKQKSLEKGLIRAAEGRCYLEWSDPEKLGGEEREKVPVEFKNPKVLLPFQMLVKNYAIPEYGTVDPTPFVAIAYLIMFGLMFGDAGHGAVFALLGLIGRFLFRGKGEGRYNLAGLIMWCGFASIITGVLFGSYFGMQWFRPIWLDYHGILSGHVAGGIVRDIYGVLAITIYFGIAVIGMGLLINWINLSIKGSWLKLVLDKAGLIGGWMYGAGIYVAFKYVRSGYKVLPPASLLFWLLGIPVLILLVKAPLEYALESKKYPNRKITIFTLIDFFMEWIVTILEIFSGYLANTLSFMRVAGLGIAHVSLMIAFFEIARMIGRDGKIGVLSILILILGNLLVIALEGLSAGIQALRLNYYEFFSKYFTGRGIAYLPVSLKKRD